MADAISVKVKQGGVWVDSGYVAYSSAPTNFRSTSVGNGDNRQVTFAWNAGAGGAPVTNYVVNVYNSSDVYQYGVSFGTSTSGTITFGAAGTTYYVRIYAGGDAGYTEGTNSVGGSRIRVTTGAASYAYDNSGWGSNVLFTPGYLSQSAWPGEPYGDFTYHGSKAFDGNSGTYWTGQSWAWSGGSEWVSFQIGNALTPRIKIVELYNLPSGNAPGTINLDEFSYPNFNYTGYSWGGASAFGYQIIPCGFEIAAGTTRYFRFWYTDLGYNPTAYGNYRVLTAEVSGVYQPWITDVGTTPATANTTTNA